MKNKKVKIEMAALLGAVIFGAMLSRAVPPKNIVEDHVTVYDVDTVKHTEIVYDTIPVCSKIVPYYDTVPVEKIIKIPYNDTTEFRYYKPYVITDKEEPFVKGDRIFIEYTY